MFHQTEAKAQGWRALAVLADGGTCLLYLGRSLPQVRAGYAAAFADFIEGGKRAGVRAIVLQSWQGAPDRGRWSFQGTLPVPSARAAGGAVGHATADGRCVRPTG